MLDLRARIRATSKGAFPMSPLPPRQLELSARQKETKKPKNLYK